jgi:hypothetical protein
MAVEAIIGKDRADVAIEVDRKVICVIGTAGGRETEQNEGNRQNSSAVALN